MDSSRTKGGSDDFRQKVPSCETSGGPANVMTSSAVTPGFEEQISGAGLVNRMVLSSPSSSPSARTSTLLKHLELSPETEVSPLGFDSFFCQFGVLNQYEIHH